MDNLLKRMVQVSEDKKWITIAGPMVMMKGSATVLTIPVAPEQAEHVASELREIVEDLLRAMGETIEQRCNDTYAERAVKDIFKARLGVEAIASELFTRVPRVT